MTNKFKQLKELQELIKTAEINEYGTTYTKYSGKKIDYLVSIAEEMNEKCENKNYDLPYPLNGYRCFNTYPLWM
jgi:hypothetical protein